MKPHGNIFLSRVTAYVRSFRIRNDDLSKPLEVNIRETYKSNFKKIFDEEWNGDGLIGTGETGK